jgi:hypothetical protein
MSVYLIAKNPVGTLEELRFQYTPQIEYSNDVKYDAYSLTHTNYQPYAYSRTENPTIGLTCKFSAHTKEHFDHSEYAIRFLRTYTKMNYGRTDTQRGQSPRILRFFAHGSPIFNKVPVVISKFSMTFPDDIDYVKGTFSPDNKLIDATRDVKKPTTEVPQAGADGVPEMIVTGQKTKEFYLPVFFTINISLLMQPNIYKAVNEFNLEDFSKGALSSKGYI